METIYSKKRTRKSLFRNGDIVDYFFLKPDGSIIDAVMNAESYEKAIEVFNGIINSEEQLDIQFIGELK
jgi:hypothetical protein